MQTLTITTILSEVGLLTIRNFIKEHKKQQFQIFETSSKKYWISKPCFNGNPWDLWLIKKGTQGNTRKTFIRLYLIDESEVLKELVSRKINVSPLLQKTVDVIEQNKKSDFEKQLQLLENFSNVERAKNFINLASGNSHQRRTKWGNFCVKLNLPRNFYPRLREKCFDLIKISHSM